MYYKDRKENDEMIFSHMTCLYHTAVNFKQQSINIFV